MSERYICIHGHFYQPPRENAWLEAIEIQDSAYPYHDWNARISAECYGANARSRILDGDGWITDIVNNYAKISFNFGPTLLAWMEALDREVYDAVLQADHASRKRFSGHGSALAQAYNHMILPLAGRRDKKTQILWGIADFEHRFGRFPEGMWLPETAVDLESLEVLAECGIKFTMLSPYQAGRVRSLEEDEWHDVSPGGINPAMPYLKRLPDGREITIFFYDGPISRAIAFENLLDNGEAFANRLYSGFDSSREQPQLVHVATDGETYGHHQRYGDMALAYALDYIERCDFARLTNYGEYLEKFPPTHEVQIQENTSWSCRHGIERWRSDCGCKSGFHPGWNQKWRGPLRNAFDAVRGELIPLFEKESGKYLNDPWQARDAYIDVILDRSADRVERFLKAHAKHPVEGKDRVRVFKLLEMQRHTLLMYTSCGWYFDDISGIETIQTIQYAGRAIQLAGMFDKKNMEADFLDLMAQAKSNIPEHRDGRRIYEKFVKPAVVDIEKVAAHYAVSSLFTDYDEQAAVYCYQVLRPEYVRTEAGKARLALGQARIISEITRESEAFTFGVLYMGDHNVSCGIRRNISPPSYQALKKNLTAGFDRADFPEILRQIDESFDSKYSLISIFRDRQREIVNSILESTIEDAISVYRHLYEYNVPLMRFLKNSATPVPPALQAAGDQVVNNDLRMELGRDQSDYDAIYALMREADLVGIRLDTDTLEYTLRQKLERIGKWFSRSSNHLELLQEMDAGIDLVYALPFDANLRKVQNVYYDLRRRLYPEYRRRAELGDHRAGEWLKLFDTIGEKLMIRM